MWIALCGICGNVVKYNNVDKLNDVFITEKGNQTMKKMIKPLKWLVFVTASFALMSAFAEGCGIVTTDKDPLNIRQQASLTAEVIDLAIRGSALRILDTNEAWYQVKLNNGKIGYASQDYIKTLTPKNEEVCGIVMTDESELNIRLSASLRSEVITTASKDSALRIAETYGAWYQVMLNHFDKDGNIILGYASRDYVQLLH